MQYAIERVALVLAGRIVPTQATNVLKAATLIMDALAGPQQIKVAHSLADDHAALVFATVETNRREVLERARQQLDGPPQLAGAATVDGTGATEAPDAA
jgi:hypothetical protein